MKIRLVEQLDERLFQLKQVADIASRSSDSRMPPVVTRLRNTIQEIEDTLRTLLATTNSELLNTRKHSDQLLAVLLGTASQEGFTPEEGIAIIGEVAQALHLKAGSLRYQLLEQLVKSSVGMQGRQMAKDLQKQNTAVTRSLKQLAQQLDDSPLPYRIDIPRSGEKRGYRFLRVSPDTSNG